MVRAVHGQCKYLVPLRGLRRYSGLRLASNKRLWKRRKRDSLTLSQTHTTNCNDPLSKANPPRDEL